MPACIPDSLKPTGIPSGNVPGTCTYLFEDEFDGPAGAPPDPAKWVNNPKEGQADDSPQPGVRNKQRAENVYQDGQSSLVIHASLDEGTGQWYSGALTTLGKSEIGINTAWEARIKYVPQAGVWPAWWMMGSYPGDEFGGGWPVCGEVDVLEYFGSSGTALTTVHTNTSTGWDPLSYKWVETTHPRSTTLIPPFISQDSNWHVYRLVWKDAGMTFFFDGALYQFVPAGSLLGWPFNDPDKKLYQILDLGIGGPGGESLVKPLPPTLKQADLWVDYIRVWAI